MSFLLDTEPMRPRIPRSGLVCWHRLHFPNALLYSEAMATSPWVGATSGSGSLPTATAGAGTAPDGSENATRLQFDKGAGTATSDFSIWNQPCASMPNPHPGSVGVWLKSYDGVSTYQMTLYERGESGDRSLVTVTGEWQFFKHNNASVPSTASGFGMSLRGAMGTSQTADVLAWGAQWYPAATLPAYAATTTLQSIADLAPGGAYPLTRGSNATAADAADPTVLGPGLSFVTDDYCLTGNLSGITMAGNWTLILACLCNGSAGRVAGIGAGASDYQDIVYSAATAIKLQSGSTAGGSSLSGALTVSATSPSFLIAQNNGGAMSLTRKDTATTVTVTSEEPTGTPKLTVACKNTATAPADALTVYELLLYNRVLNSGVVGMACRAVKAWWAAQGVAIL